MFWKVGVDGNPGSDLAAPLCGTGLEFDRFLVRAHREVFALGGGRGGRESNGEWKRN